MLEELECFPNGIERAHEEGEQIRKTPIDGAFWPAACIEEQQERTNVIRKEKHGVKITERYTKLWSVPQMSGDPRTLPHPLTTTDPQHRIDCAAQGGTPALWPKTVLEHGDLPQQELLLPPEKPPKPPTTPHCNSIYVLHSGLLKNIMRPVPVVIQQLRNSLPKHQPPCSHLHFHTQYVAKYYAKTSRN